MNRDRHESTDASGGTNTRTPTQIRAEGNRLAGEGSAYLRQHAHNPLDWYPWGEEALSRARAEDKPIFLSIGYSSCHWCHVMEDEVFDRDEVAAFMNARFVSIKVDREERPDLDAVYMEAVQALTGGGGWPMSVFLTPDLKPFYGGTYFPRAQFLALAAQIETVYREKKDVIAKQTTALNQRLAQFDRTFPGPPLDAGAVETVAASAAGRFDDEWGGTRGRMKFPTPVLWTFLLHHYRKTGDERYAQMVRKTLDRMGDGGINDHVGGGFHRYTVDDVWLVPHFEKMLYDNAQLARLYVEAAAVFTEPRYREIAADTLDFLVREMSGDGGAIYASLDADSGGEEGTYYVWTPEQIDAVCGADGPALSRLLGVSAGGNFEGASVLTRRVDPDQVATLHKIPVEAARGLFATHREALRSAREKRVAPGLDRKIVTGWNGMAIGALALGSTVLGEPRYLDYAGRAADFLWRVHRRADGRLYRASTDGEPVGEGMLDDYAYLALGFLELYQASGNPTHLARAVELAGRVRADFAAENGAWHFTPAGAEAPMGRKVELFDQAVPSGNAVFLQVLVRIAALTGDREALAEVDRALSAYADILRQAGLEMAGWLDAAEQRNGPFYEIVVVGDPAAAQTIDLVAAYHDVAPSHAVLIQVPADTPPAELVRLVPSIEQKPAVDGRPTAYPCRFGACDEPIADPARLRDTLLSGWVR